MLWCLCGNEDASIKIRLQNTITKVCKHNYFVFNNAYSVLAFCELIFILGNISIREHQCTLVLYLVFIF